jgi:hypothetical protein
MLKAFPFFTSRLRSRASRRRSRIRVFSDLIQSISDRRIGFDLVVIAVNFENARVRDDVRRTTFARSAASGDFITREVSVLIAGLLWPKINNV